MPAATITARPRITGNSQLEKREPVTPSWVGRVPQLKPGTYADGMPFHQVQYLCCKQADFAAKQIRFTRESF